MGVGRDSQREALTLAMKVDGAFSHLIVETSTCAHIACFVLVVWHMIGRSCCTRGVGCYIDATALEVGSDLYFKYQFW